jgi:amino acid transporter
MLGYVLAQFSKYMTSAGTYYTFVSRSLGGRVGFLVLVPLVGTIALGCVVLWLALGIVMLFAMIASGRESMLARAGDAVAERMESPEERAARPEFI